MTPELATAVTRMCDKIWKVCPWAAPEGYVPPATFDFKTWLEGQMGTP